jgi:hypothetical protein
MEAGLHVVSFSWPDAPASIAPTVAATARRREHARASRVGDRSTDPGSISADVEVGKNDRRYGLPQPGPSTRLSPSGP